MDESACWTKTRLQLREMSVWQLLDRKRRIIETDKPFALPPDEEREVQLIRGEIISRTVRVVPHTDAHMALGLISLFLFTIAGFIPELDWIHGVLGILVCAWIIVHRNTLLAAMPAA